MELESLLRAGDVASVTEIMRSGGIEANGLLTDGLTPLMIAAGLGQPRMVELLLKQGASVLAMEPHMGATPLHKAAQSGSPDVVSLLLDHGAFVDQQSPTLGHTALMDAVQHKHLSVVRLLLDRQAKTKLRNHYQQTARDLARQDQFEAAITLLEARDEADSREAGKRHLIAASKTGDRAEVERLILAGADLNERFPMIGDFEDNYTPLGVAARDGHVDIVVALLDAGANIRALNGLMRATPGHEAAFGGRHEALLALINNGQRTGKPGLEIDARGQYNGFTALHDAVWHGHLGAVRALVEAGARLDLVSHGGRTPRQMAVLYEYSEIADYLAESEKN